MPRYRIKFLLQEIDLPIGQILIGRSLDCHLTIEDPLVSRKHATIIVTNDNAIFKDLGSRNGSLVNGEPIFDEILLKDGDRIRIGTQELVFHEINEDSRRAKITGFLRYCNSCHVPFPEGTPICPHCGTPVEIDSKTKTCPKCKGILKGEEVFCTRCGYNVKENDELKITEETVQVDLRSITQQSWAYELVMQLIEKSLTKQRYDNLKDLLTKIKTDVEFNWESKKSVDDDLLTTLIIGTMKLYEMTGEKDEFACVLNLYKKMNKVISEKVVKNISDLTDKGNITLEVIDDYWNYLSKIKDKFQGKDKDNFERLSTIMFQNGYKLNDEQ